MPKEAPESEREREETFFRGTGVIVQGERGDFVKAGRKRKSETLFLSLARKSGGKKRVFLYSLAYVVRSIYPSPVDVVAVARRSSRCLSLSLSLSLLGARAVSSTSSVITAGMRI